MIQTLHSCSYIFLFVSSTFKDFLFSLLPSHSLPFCFFLFLFFHFCFPLYRSFIFFRIFLLHFSFSTIFNPSRFHLLFLSLSNVLLFVFFHLFIYFSYFLNYLICFVSYNATHLVQPVRIELVFLADRTNVCPFTKPHIPRSVIHTNKLFG